MSLKGVNGRPTLLQLPPTLRKLSSLSFEEMHLQLQPGGGHQGLLGAGPPLKQLHLNECTLVLELEQVQPC